MRRIAIIGAGGINSWFVKHLKEIIKIFDKKNMIYVKLFDNDVVEEKNLLRGNQNFLVEDLMEDKAEALSKRYSFDFEKVFVTEENISTLDSFDDVILGVDNHKARQLIYKHCLEKGIYLLDLRAQGTQIAFYVLDHNKKMDYYNKKFFNNETVMERKGSCQLSTDIENDHVENGNKIIAYFGAYGIFMKKLRGEDPGVKEWKIAY